MRSYISPGELDLHTAVESCLLTWHQNSAPSCVLLHTMCLLVGITVSTVQSAHWCLGAKVLRTCGADEGLGWE